VVKNFWGLSETVKRFSLIGAGNVGLNLIQSLVKKGYDFRYIYKKAKYDYFSSRLSEDIGSIVRESDFIFIATRESQIAEAAHLIARQSDPAGKFFFHTSNSLTSEQLRPIKEKGGFTASFSPLQTFVDFKPGCDLFRGIYFLIEGDDRALQAAQKIADKLEAFILVVDKEEKNHFHIAAVSSSNFLISILKFAESQLKKCALPGRDRKYDIRIMLPLIKQTLQNVEERGIDASLSGPLERKEFAILGKHLSLLAQDEADFYRTLTGYLKQ
jgi:predicted short-subunit dehydrogenase-like oxidoreductase (DUF2520 family)